MKNSFFKLISGKVSFLLILFLALGSCNEDELPSAIVLDNDCKTVVAPAGAQPGDKYQVNNEIYLVVDAKMLHDMIIGGEDVTKVITSLVTNMYGLFLLQTDFDQNISSWDVSNVTNMSLMFQGATSFNTNIDCWDVGNVMDMSLMFSWAAFDPMEFNQPLGSWDVSMVTDMSGMFLGASLFNQDISAWDVSNTIYCSDFFLDANSWTLPKPNFTNCDPN